MTIIVARYKKSSVIPVSSMAFSKSRISLDEQGKSLIYMPFEPSASLSGILKTGPPDQGQYNVMDGRQNPPGDTFGHAGGIFSKGHIPAIMQTGFDQPVLPSKLHYSLGRGLFSGEAGEAVLHLPAGFEHFPLAHPSKTALQPVDLSQTGPIKIIVELTLV